MAIVEVPRLIVGGVDTHLDVHVAAAVDSVGGLLAVRSFPTTPAGHHALSSWLGSFGVIERVGVEGTGTYGAGLARHLAAGGLAVVRLIVRIVRSVAATASPMSSTRSRHPGGAVGAGARARQGWHRQCRGAAGVVGREAFCALDPDQDQRSASPSGDHRS
jgi:transposase